MLVCLMAASGCGQDQTQKNADGMSHDGGMNKETIEFLRQLTPDMADRSDEEIVQIMQMMPPNYELYVSEKDLTGGVGVLVVTHGFGETGDRIFAESIQPVADVYPTAISFGMAMMTSAHIQSAVEDLVAAGAKQIVVVPATQSKHDTGIRQYQYIAGHREEPAYMAVPQVVTEAQLLVTPPLSDHPLVSEILLDHATELSTNQEDEVVIIVGHGPVSDEDNARELAMVGRHVEYIRENSQFADVMAINLQDDSAKATRASNVETLREAVEAAVQDGHQVLIVGFLLGTAGIQPKVDSDLQGLDYKFNTRGMSEHPGFSAWVAAMVNQAVN